MLKVFDLNLVDNVLHLTLQEKSSGIKSGEVGNQAIGPPLAINLTAIFLPR
jgi:hypothetical protein